MYFLPLAIALFLMPFEALSAQTTRHYDDRGRYVGKSVTNERVIRHYDDRGRLQRVSKRDDRK